MKTEAQLNKNRDNADKMIAWLVNELKTARQYVHANHSVIASALGHENTVVKPDLDRIDAAITACEPALPPAMQRGTANVTNITFNQPNATSY